jgi:hypothetical protein
LGESVAAVMFFWLAFASACCLIAVLPMPYWYYPALRWVVFLAAVGGAWIILRKRFHWSLLLVVAVAVLFNPFDPIHMHKAWWIVVDIASAFVVLWPSVYDNWGDDPSRTSLSDVCENRIQKLEERRRVRRERPKSP